MKIVFFLFSNEDDDGGTKCEYMWIPRRFSHSRKKKYCV